MTKADKRKGRTGNSPTAKPENASPSDTDAPMSRKSLIAAILTVITGVLTASIIAIPGLASKIFGSALTVDGESRPWSSSLPSHDIAERDPVGSTSECLGGRFVLPEKIDLNKSMSTKSLKAILRNAIYADGAAGSYVVQARTGQAVVVTGIHTVVTARTKADPKMVIDIVSPCAPCAAADRSYRAFVDLDSNDLSPEITVGVPEEGGGCGSGKRQPIEQIKDVVTNDQPIYIGLYAATTKYDVKWKMRIDYSVDGETKSAWIQDDSRPFHVVATNEGDNIVRLVYRGDHWESE